jgi:hypothetical protein
MSTENRVLGSIASTRSHQIAMSLFLATIELQKNQAATMVLQGRSTKAASAHCVLDNLKVK